MNVKVRREIRSKNERDGEPWTQESQEQDLEAKKVYDHENHHVDLSKLRVTSLTSCRRVFLPRPAEEQCEVFMRSLSFRMMQEFRK